MSVDLRSSQLVKVANKLELIDEYKSTKRCLIISPFLVLKGFTVYYSGLYMGHNHAMKVT